MNLTNSRASQIAQIRGMGCKNDLTELATKIAPKSREILMFASKKTSNKALMPQCWIILIALIENYIVD